MAGRSIQSTMKRFTVAAAMAVVISRGAIGMAAELAATQPSQESISGLIGQLDADDFATRENAQAKLIDAGAAAKDALVQASKTGSPEQRLRAAEILRRM